MARTKLTRKAPVTVRRFHAALKAEGMTAREWAKAQDVTPEHLSMVLWGKRESRTLNDKIKTFTDATLRKAQVAA